MPTAESRAFRPEPMALTIVFEDDAAAGDRQAGRAGGASGGRATGRAPCSTACCAHHAARGRLPRAGIVHRLDKDTSGLMVVGKTLRR